MSKSKLKTALGIVFTEGKYQKILFDSLLFLWVVWVLFPLLDTGLVSDDAYNSQISGAILTQGVTLWQRIWEEVVGWAVGAGRIYPLNYIYLYVFYYFDPNILLVKLITLSIICIDVLLFSKIIRTLTRNQNLPYLCAFLIPLFFQFRFWHDAILGFTFLMPLMCLFFFVSILLLIKYLENKKNSYLIYLILLYIVSMLTYEIAYSFVLVYVSIFLFGFDKKNSVKFLLIVLFLTFGHFFLGQYIHLSHLSEGGTSTYAGSKLNLDIIPALHALYIQATAAIPLSWKFANAPFHQKFYEIGLENFIAYAAFATLFCTALFKFDKNSLNKNIIYKIIFFSLCTLLGPALAIAASGHQKELIDAGFGYGYTPVFIQYFGLCILILFLLLFVKDMSSGAHYKKIFFVLIWIVVFSVGAITREENILIVEESNKFYKYPRELLGESIKNGILDEVGEKDLILRNERYPSDYIWFYAMKANRKINVCGLNIKHEFPECIEKHSGSEGKIYGTTYFLGENYTKGSVLIAEIDEVFQIDNIPMEIPFKNYKIYNSVENVLSTYTSEKSYDFLKVMEMESDIKSASYDISEFLIDKELNMRFTGFHIREGDTKKYLRWSSGNSMMIVLNKTDNFFLVREMRLNLIRPRASDNKPAIVYISHNDYRSKHIVAKTKEIKLSFVFSPGINYIKFESESPPIDNGDPRNIVFGIANYSLNDI